MKLIIGMMVVLSLFLVGCDNDGVMCTMDAKLCPDGSYVGREGPNCEFKECPTFDGMSLEEALEIAAISCTSEGSIGSIGYYNPNSKTWWIEFTPSEAKEGCNPRCVVSENGGAEINWMCTGLLSGSDSKCTWKSGTCEMEIGPGYYYNQKTKQCEYLEIGSGCSNPPFETLEECKSICEKV